MGDAEEEFVDYDTNDLSASASTSTSGSAASSLSISSSSSDAASLLKALNTTGIMQSTSLQIAPPPPQMEIVSSTVVSQGVRSKTVAIIALALMFGFAFGFMYGIAYAIRTKIRVDC